MEQSTKRYANATGLANRADVAVVYSHLALRYTRIFPELFEQLPLPCEEHNVTTHYAVGAVVDGAPSARPVRLIHPVAIADF